MISAAARAEVYDPLSTIVFVLPSASISNGLRSLYKRVSQICVPEESESLLVLSVEDCISQSFPEQKNK